MKTAIQEAISELKELRDEEMAAGWEGEAYAYDIAIGILNELLKKEKEQIEQAFHKGREERDYQNSLWDCKSGLDYYNQTFNTQEQ
jgi:hypothetical protein